jgi:beta-N-acetylhexosaminidase
VDRASEPGQLLFAGFEGLEAPADLLALVAAGRVGGVVLFARNVAGFAATRRLADALHAGAPADAPLCLAIDQEGGRVQRLRAPWTEWPPMRRLGELGSLDETRAVARALARELADLRVDLDFAPVADVDSNPANPVIGDRSFSRSPEAVARHVAAFVEALQDGGVAACAKHFPGHGDTSEDSHVALPRVDCDLERLRRVELVPFRAAAAAGVASMMTAHVLLPRLDPELPATLSAEVLACLRREIGYEGLVFSDDLEMAAVAEHFDPGTSVRRALEAGVDAFLVCRRADLRGEVLAALEAAPARLVAGPLRRMAALKRRFAGGRRASGGEPPYAEHLALARRLGREPDRQATA